MGGASVVAHCHCKEHIGTLSGCQLTNTSGSLDGFKQCINASRSCEPESRECTHQLDQLTNVEQGQILVCQSTESAEEEPSSDPKFGKYRNTVHDVPRGESIDLIGQSRY